MRHGIVSGMLYGEHTTLQQITKPTARKLHALGQSIYMHPSNMRMFNSWTTPCEIEHSDDLAFDSIVDEYEYHNCNCNETGKYAVFFKRIK